MTASKSSRPSYSRRQAASLLGRAGVAAVFAGGTGFSLPARAADKLLRIRIGADIGNLDPARIFQIENQTVASQIYNGLVKYDQATNKIVPDLASEWSVSDDGTVYTFKLRSGVVWHKNHGPFTADDVKFSIERVLNPETHSPYSAQLTGIKSIDALETLVVRIVLNQPNAGLLHKLTAFNQGWMVSRKALAAIGEQKYPLQPVGTGPFVFEKWTPGNEVRLSANKQYFEGAPKVDGLTFRLIPDETAAAIALQNGEIDIFFALQQPEVIDQLRKVTGITVLDRAANHTVNLVLNTTKKPLDDVRVRQALISGINRQALIDGFFKGTKTPAFNVLTASFPEFTKSVPEYPFDPARAKALLKEAGGDGFSLDLVTVALNPYDKIVVPIASDLNALGIKTTIKVLERGAYLQARTKGDVMTAVTAVVGPPDPDNPIISLYARKSFPPGLNTAHYTGIEELLAKLAATQDPAGRTAIYQQILVQTMTDVPTIPLFADRLFLAHGKAVQGLVQNSLFTVQAYTVSLQA